MSEQSGTQDSPLEVEVWKDYEKSDGYFWTRKVGQDASLISNKSQFPGHQKEIKGTVVAVDYSHDFEPYRPGTVTLYQKGTRQLVDIDLETLQPKNVEVVVPIEDLGLKVMVTPHDDKEELQQAFKENPVLDAIFFGETLDKDKRFAISGKLSYEEIRPGYFAFRIVDFEGKTHLIDGNLLSDRSRIFSTLPGHIPAEYFQIRTHDELRIIDANYEKRRKLIKDLAASGIVFDNPEFYKYYRENFDEAKKLLERWYGSEGEKIVEKINRELGVDFLCFALDPGIANRLDEFVEFTQKNLDIRFQNPDQIRRAFSGFLGNQTIYRALMLTDDELKEITYRKMMLPIGMRNRPDLEERLMEMFTPYKAHLPTKVVATPLQDIKARLDPFSSPEGTIIDSGQHLADSNILSVSEYPELALSVVYYDTHRNDIPGVDLYLFEMNVPAISVVKQEGLFEFPNDGYDIKIGDKIIKSNDRGIEMFIFYGLNTSTIKAIRKIESPPPKYEWVKQPD